MGRPEKEEGRVKKREKVQIIRNWWEVGLIKRLGPRTYTVPSNAFAFGITPRLVAEVLAKGEVNNAKGKPSGL